MNIKAFPTWLLILVTLIAAATGSYTLGRLLPGYGLPVAPGQPPLVQVDIPSQTQNGYTATLEGVYADATLLLFAVRVSTDSNAYFLDRVSLKDARGEEINASMGFGAASPTDQSVTMMEFNPVTPIADRLNGKLEFSIVPSPGEGEVLAQFSFDLDLPVHPALTFDPKQAISSNGVEIFLDRIIITPAYTQAYLCYKNPTSADWMVSGEASLRVGNQQVNLNTYSLLFDSAFGDMGKGGEPDWAPPVQTGRCVKVGFPIGESNPQAITLTIPTLEQSTPEVIPDEDLVPALKILKTQGIDMEWHTADHGAYPEYKELPAGMNEQQAFRAFIEVLGYVYKGPWVFNLQLNVDKNTNTVFSTSAYGAATPIPFPTAKPKIAATLPGRIRSFNISPDMKTIAFATSQGVVLYDLKSYKHLQTLNEAESVYLVEWSPDGKKLAAEGLVVKSSEFGRSHLIVWDTSTWESVFEQTGDDNTLDIIYGDIAWSPDSRSLASSINGMGVVVHDIQTGQVISKQDTLSSYGISWSPDGSRLVATGDLAYGIRRWKVSTDESVRLFDQRAGSSMQIAWSPDGKRIASGHSEGQVCFWTAATNKCDGFIYAHRNAVVSLAWSPDGNQLATGVGVIRVWDAHTGKLITSFGLNDISIYTHLEWPDINQPLVSAEAGYADAALNIVRFWDVDTGKILFEFDGASGSFGE